MIELSTSFLRWTQQPLQRLPPLPKVVRYYDNFSDSYCELKDIASCDSWIIHSDGKTSSLDFTTFPPSLRHLLKCWCAASLPAYSPRTFEVYLRALSLNLTPAILDVISSGPLELRSTWSALLGMGTPFEIFSPLSNILHFLCEHSVHPWAPEWDDLITLQPYPKRDKYAAVRTGDVFITPEEEQSYVKVLDSVVNRTNEERNGLTSSELREAAILLIAYQFGMRPKQIAMLRLRDVRLWEDALDAAPAVHLTFHMIKQMNPGKVLSLRRKVKQDWASVFVEYRKRQLNAGKTPNDHLFSLAPLDVQRAIFRITGKLGNARGATELRHSFAQRMVDAGCTAEELAEALGHSHLETSLVYFTYSRTMAARVNTALGISETYKTVLRFAHEPFISSEELCKLKGDLQIGGTPHGVPIAGIGGCNAGQPNCPFNPVLSCYGCNRFMPLVDKKVHLQVLDDLVQLFNYILSSSYAEPGSPAFQLEVTIAYVRAVLSELDGVHNELEP